MTERLEVLRGQVDAALERAVAEACGVDGPVPPRLREAMGYALLGGGKRMRPVLALASASAVGGDPEAALSFACALEMIHAYSLVHDDLPCMDDDAERRGMPTVHVRYGQATAVLTGDALLTEAFAVVARSALAPARVVRLVALLAEAAGASGMVGGQELDMAGAQEVPPVEAVRQLHAMKTGALFRAAARGGAIAGGADPVQEAALERYGVAVGRAFQLIDDALEVEQGEVDASDAHEAAVSLALRLGVAAARAEAQALVEEARQIAAGFGARGEQLAAIAARVESRRS